MAEAPSQFPGSRSGPAIELVGIVLAVAATAYGLFHLWYSTVDTIAESWRNAVHVGGAMAFVFAFAARSAPSRG